MAERPIYETEAAALLRVKALIRRGIWPGVVRVRVHDRLFAYRLTYDPPVTVSQIANHGGLKSP